MKSKLILSLISFILCVTLYIGITFAWITLKSINSGNNTTLQLAGDNCTVTLSKLEGSNWVQLNNNSIADLGVYNPGDIVYLKLSLIPTKSEPVIIKSGSFGTIESMISNEVNYNDGSLYVKDFLNNDLKIAAFLNNQVLVDVDGVNKTLYTYADGEVQLGDFQVGNTVRFYNLSGVDTTGITSTDYSYIEGVAVSTMDQKIFNDVTLNPNTTVEFIFGITISLNEMTEVVNSVDVDYSYCYMYQTFKIRTIFVDAS